MRVLPAAEFWPVKQQSSLAINMTWARPPKNQDGAGPIPQRAPSDFAVAFGLTAANLSDRLDGETLMVVDATEEWVKPDLLVGYCSAPDKAPKTVQTGPLRGKPPRIQ